MKKYINPKKISYFKIIVSLKNIVDKFDLCNLRKTFFIEIISTNPQVLKKLNEFKKKFQVMVIP
jgi:hypothetical protein